MTQDAADQGGGDDAGRGADDVPNQATKEQRRALYQLVLNDADIVRDLIRAMTSAEAESVIGAFRAAEARTRTA